jgi:hypothetical protein
MTLFCYSLCVRMVAESRGGGDSFCLFLCTVTVTVTFTTRSKAQDREMPYTLSAMTQIFLSKITMNQPVCLTEHSRADRY